MENFTGIFTYGIGRGTCPPRCSGHNRILFRVRFAVSEWMATLSHLTALSLFRERAFVLRKLHANKRRSRVEYCAKESRTTSLLTRCERLSKTLAKVRSLAGLILGFAR